MLGPILCANRNRGEIIIFWKNIAPHDLDDLLHPSLVPRVDLHIPNRVIAVGDVHPTLYLKKYVTQDGGVSDPSAHASSLCSVFS